MDRVHTVVFIYDFSHHSDYTVTGHISPTTVTQHKMIHSLCIHLFVFYIYCAFCNGIHKCVQTSLHTSAFILDFQGMLSTDGDQTVSDITTQTYKRSHQQTV